MSRRGIRGSSIEAGRMGDLYQYGLGQLGETDRQLAEVGAGRAFSANQANTAREMDTRTYNASGNMAAQQTNASNQMQAQQAQADFERQRMNLLISLYSQIY
jgi:hypothetical protein